MQAELYTLLINTSFKKRKGKEKCCNKIIILKKFNNPGLSLWLTPLIPEFVKQRQADLGEFRLSQAT